MAVRHVVEDREVLDRVVAALEAGGHRVRWTWAADPDAVCAGTVRDADDAGEALLAALGGAGLAVHLDAPDAVAVPFLDDLRHLGPVARGEPPPVVAIDDDQRRLVALMGEGQTLSAAASELGMSRRTATRRMAELRAALGVSSTAEAVLRVTSEDRR